jgi:hypothetical protein
MQPKNIKSKDSRNALRRWNFEAKLTHDDGSLSTKKMPGSFFGTHNEALEMMKQLEARFRDSTKNVSNIEIRPLAYETISFETRQQLLAMNSQANLVMQAAYILAEELRVALKSDKTMDELVQIAIGSAQEIRRAEYTGQITKNGPIAQDSSQEPSRILQRPTLVASPEEVQREMLRLRN